MLPPSDVPSPSGNPRRRPAVTTLKLDPAPPRREASDRVPPLRRAGSAATLRRRSDPAPRDGPHAAREPDLAVPPLRSSGGRLNSHYQDEIRGSVRARGAREGDSEPAVRAPAALSRRAQQELCGGRESHPGSPLVGPARRPEREPRQTRAEAAGDPQLHT